MVNMHYDFCLNKCAAKKEQMGFMQACKTRCYKDIMVKYKMVAH